MPTHHRTRTRAVATTTSTPPNSQNFSTARMTGSTLESSPIQPAPAQRALHDVVAVDSMAGAARSGITGRCSRAATVPAMQRCREACSQHRAEHSARSSSGSAPRSKAEAARSAHATVQRAAVHSLRSVLQCTPCAQCTTCAMHGQALRTCGGPRVERALYDVQLPRVQPVCAVREGRGERARADADGKRDQELGQRVTRVPEGWGGWLAGCACVPVRMHARAHHNALRGQGMRASAPRRGHGARTRVAPATRTRTASS